MICLFGTTFGQWFKVEAVSPGSIYSIWSSGDTLLAGGDSVLFYSFDAGNNWGKSSTVPEVEFGITAIMPVNGGMYIGTSFKGVFFTSNMGGSWDERSSGLTGLGAKEISDIALRDNEIFVSTIGGGVYKNSLNNPGDWTLFSDGIPWNTGWTVYCIKNIDGDLYAGGGVNGYFYVNRKNTNIWQEMPIDGFNGEVNGVHSFEKSGNKIVASSHQAVYTSTDNGLTWTKFTFGIGLIENSEISVKGNDIVICLTKASRYYIYYSNDNGITWWRNDMQSGYVSYSLNLADGKIWAGRLDGLYYKPDTITGIGDDNKTPVSFSLSQNYPNPFNSSTIIEYALPEEGDVTIELYDITGRLVKQLLKEQRTVGTHKTTVESGDLASGVYIYTLRANDIKISKKLVILK
ncbi:MAG: T9SS type A sorting domain-containing protein [Ignavibacteriales bacterium]|nr:T9SS type A sorting domain-containing protein [Ignavibacteriales bacterium]